MTSRQTLLEHLRRNRGYRCDLWGGKTGIAAVLYLLLTPWTVGGAVGLVIIGSAIGLDYTEV